jgi:hypothetical protein
MRLLLRLPRRPHQIVIYSFSLAIFLLLSSMLFLYWCEILPKIPLVEPREWPLMLVFLSVVVVMTILLFGSTLGVAWRLLHECYPILVYSYRESGILILKNIPWLERSFKFDEIVSLLVVKSPYEGNSWLRLCIEIKGRRRLMRLMEMRTNSGRITDDLQRIIMPVANIIAEEMQIPVKEEYSTVDVWRHFWSSSV